MSIPAIWKRACERLPARRTFAFAAGLWNPLKAGFYCPRHRHAAIEVVLHPAGRGTTNTESGTFAFAEGSAVVYAPGEWHDQTMETAGEDICVQVALPRGARSWPRAGFVTGPVERPWLVEEMRHLCRSQAGPGGFEQRVIDLRATAVLLALVDMAVSREDAVSPAERHVRRAEQFIHEHFATLRSLSDVAAHVGVTPDHLRHLFKKLRGRSLIRHVNEVRIARARTLLASSPFPLKQVASMCGFRDEYYFSAVFRRFAKLSPGQYRRQAGISGAS